jgi:hypothetical protein
MRRLMRAWRAATHARRLARAEWDLKHAVSGLAHYVAEVKKCDATLEKIERESIDVDYPPPAILRRGT